jgi:DNA-binding NtrC family response regulator
MNETNILVVDDEKNIRLTLSRALESDFNVDLAVNGEEALEKIEEKEYALVLLDLKMPGMDGMVVLKKIAGIRPDIRFIIITAHGTIDTAVEAMKLGAVDFLQKPFSPAEIRDLVARVLERDRLDERRADEYEACIELAKKNIGQRHFKAAEEFLRKAASLEPKRPEVFNLLGAVAEIRGDMEEATKYYRSGYWIDPSYAPSRENLERITDSRLSGFKIDLGEPEKKDK